MNAPNQIPQIVASRAESAEPSNILRIGTNSVNAILMSFLTPTSHLFYCRSFSVILYPGIVNIVIALPGLDYLQELLDALSSSLTSTILSYPEYQEYSH